MNRLRADQRISWTAIALTVRCHRSTIQREVARNGGRCNYSAHTAHQRAVEMRSRKRFLFDLDPELADRVRRHLIAGYSPYAVSWFVGISHETIYQAIYSRRLGLNPVEVLRTRRPKRRHRHLRHVTNDGNFLGSYTPIEQRPAHIETRSVFGHWEEDLITGSKNQSAILTLTERLSRYQIAVQLPNGHSADETMRCFRTWITTNQPPIISITWDQGAELARWKQLEDHHDINVFICDPKSPWQRGTNENANRQLRYWFPRRTDLSIYTQQDMDHACHILNTTPRPIHNNHTALELYDRHARTDK